MKNPQYLLYICIALLACLVFVFFISVAAFHIGDHFSTLHALLVPASDDPPWLG